MKTASTIKAICGGIIKRFISTTIILGLYVMFIMIAMMSRVEQVINDIKAGNYFAALTIIALYLIIFIVICLIIKGIKKLFSR